LQKIYKLKFSNFSATNYVHKLISIIFSFNFQPTKYVLKTLFYKSLKIDLLNCNGYWIQIHFKLPAPLMTYVRPPSPIDVKKLMANLVFLGWSLGIIPSK